MLSMVVSTMERGFLKENFPSQSDGAVQKLLRQAGVDF